MATYDSLNMRHKGQYPMYENDNFTTINKTHKPDGKHTRI